MNKSNKIRLVDSIRTWLVEQGRVQEARALDQTTTTRRELCLLTNLDTNFSLKDLCEVFYVPYIRLGRMGRRPPKSSILIDVQTGGEIQHFLTIRALCRYLDCGVIPNSISSLLSRGGCIIRVQGRDTYLVPHGDIDLLRLRSCEVNIVNIRLELRYRGHDVSSRRSTREIGNMLGIDVNPISIGSINCDLTRKVCEHLDLEYYPKVGTPGERTPFRTTLFCIDREPMLFNSIIEASRYLKINIQSLLWLHERGQPCPYFGDLYFIEINRE